MKKVKTLLMICMLIAGHLLRDRVGLIKSERKANNGHFGPSPHASHSSSPFSGIKRGVSANKLSKDGRMKTARVDASSPHQVQGNGGHAVRKTLHGSGDGRIAKTKVEPESITKVSGERNLRSLKARSLNDDKKKPGTSAMGIAVMYVVGVMAVGCAFSYFVTSDNGRSCFPAQILSSTMDRHLKSQKQTNHIGHSPSRIKLSKTEEKRVRRLLTKQSNVRRLYLPKNIVTLYSNVKRLLKDEDWTGVSVERPKSVLALAKRFLHKRLPSYKKVIDDDIKKTWRFIQPSIKRL